MSPDPAFYAKIEATLVNGIRHAAAHRARLTGDFDLARLDFDVELMKDGLAIVERSELRDEVVEAIAIAGRYILSTPATPRPVARREDVSVGGVM